MGAADGVFGRRTRSGIESYQRGKGLAETGYLTVELSEALQALGQEARRARVRKEEAARAESERRAREEERRRAEAKAERERKAEERRRAESERRKREADDAAEETARIAQEAHAAALARTKSSDTLQAYEDYLKAYCPGEGFCGTANTRRDELLKEVLSGSIFRGALPEDHAQEEFLFWFTSTSEVIAYYDDHDLPFSDFFSSKLEAAGDLRIPGTWNIEDGKIHIHIHKRSFFEWKARGTASLYGDLLVGDHRWTEGDKESWRLEKVRDPDEKRRLEDMLKPNTVSPSEEEDRPG